MKSGYFSKKLYYLFVSSIVLIYQNPLLSVGDEFPTGNYTTPGTVNGDLIVAFGNVTPAGSLTIDGDLIIKAGYLDMGANDLVVSGDLIISNPGGHGYLVADDVKIGGLLSTNATGSAHINCSDGLRALSIATNGSTDAYVKARVIDVRGNISTKSDYNNAYVESTRWWISADNIYTHGYGNAYVKQSGSVASSDSYISVKGDIFTKSETDNAYIHAKSYIYANNIITDGYTSAYVANENSGNGQDISLKGSIKTNSQTTDAYVFSYRELNVNDIHTTANTNAYVKSRFRAINVQNDIRSVSKSGTAYIFGKTILATNIFTSGYLNSYIQSDYYGYDPFYGQLDVPGQIKTKSTNGSAYVQADGYLKTGNVTTDGKTSSYIMSSKNIQTPGNLVAQSSAGAASITGKDGISALSITTDGYDTSSTVSSELGTLTVVGAISTKNSTASAFIYANNNINAFALSTDGNTDSSIKSETGTIITTQDIISKSATNNAFISAQNNIKSRNILASGPGNSYIQSLQGSIHVDGNLDADGYITAKLGIEAKFLNATGSISTDANASFFFETTSSTTYFKNSQIILLGEDLDLNRALEIDGTSTLDGTKRSIIFGSSASITVDQDTTLLIKDITLKNIQDQNLRCFDYTSTLTLQNVILDLSGDYTFASGLLNIAGDCVINGNGHNIYYESSIPGDIFSSITFNNVILHDNGNLPKNRTKLSKTLFKKTTYKPQADCTVSTGIISFESDSTIQAIDNITKFELNGDASLEIAGQAHLSIDTGILENDSSSGTNTINGTGLIQFAPNTQWNITGALDSNIMIEFSQNSEFHAPSADIQNIKVAVTSGQPIIIAS